MLISLYIFCAGLWIFAAGCAVGKRADDALMNSAWIAAIVAGAISIIGETIIRLSGH